MFALNGRVFVGGEVCQECALTALNTARYLYTSHSERSEFVQAFVCSSIHRSTESPASEMV